MPITARLYSCCRCQAQVIICSDCDRGNRYCTGTCAADARSASLKHAGKKYRSTRAGRFNNAARQQRYRDKLKQKVTHQGSPPDKSHDLLKVKHPWPRKAVKHGQTGSDLYCHHCGCTCNAFLLLDFLHRHRFMEQQWQ